MHLSLDFKISLNQVSKPPASMSSIYKIYFQNLAKEKLRKRNKTSQTLNTKDLIKMIDFVLSINHWSKSQPDA